MRGTRLNWIRRGCTLACIVASLSGTVSPIAAGEKLQRFEFLQIRMGVPVRILVYAPDSPSAIQATDAAYKRLRKIDRTLSDYDPDSEVMRLCAHRPIGEPVPVSQDLFRVLKAAKDLSHETHGAFDVTVGPIVKLWRIARRKRVLPDEDRLRHALKHVGDEFVVLDADTQSVTLKRPEMQLDFGGIAKGYAADEALKTLQEHELPIALVAVAGDIRAGDPPPGEEGWRIEVEDQTQPPSSEHPPLILSLKNQAVSTSGDTYQYLEVDSVRYSHIVDPETGVGLTTPGSVTVVAPTGLQADGFASAISVLGPKRGLKFIAKSKQTQAFIVRLEENGERSVTTTPGWKCLLKE